MPRQSILRTSPSGPEIDVDDWDPPGGGLLRVPAGGGNVEEMRGSINGQLVYWSQSAGLWLPTPTGPSNGQIPFWNAAGNAWGYRSQPVNDGTLQGQLAFWDVATSRWIVTPTAPAADQMPSWDAAAQVWRFRDPPSVGAIQYFDVDAGTVGCWNFNETLADISGNGNAIAVEAGTTNFADIVPGKKGLWVAIGNRYGIASPTAVLAQTGDMTIETIFQMNSTPTSGWVPCAYGGSGELETANFLYTFTATANAAGAPISLSSFWETGAGADVSFSTVSPASLPPIHNIIYAAQVRSASGTRVQHYVNGKAFGALSGALTAPTGGSLSRFIVGVNSSTGTAVENGVIMGIRISNFARSAAQILASYNRTLGPGFGLLT